MNQPTSQGSIPKPAKGLRRVKKACGYSIEGISYALKKEEAFRSEVILVGLLTPQLYLMEVGVAMKLMVIISMGFILVTELLNSAIEAVVDRVCEGYDPLAKVAKDMGSAAVFISLIMSAVAWGATLWEWLT